MGVFVKIHHYLFILILGFKVNSPNFPRISYQVLIGLATEDNTDSNLTSSQMDLVSQDKRGACAYPLFSEKGEGWVVIWGIGVYGRKKYE